MKYFKNSIALLVPMIIGAIVVTSSCKKNDDVSSAPSGSQDQPTSVITTNQGNGNSYTVTANDGHLIGINSKSNVVNPKTGGPVSVEGCGASLAPGVVALSGFYLSNGQIGSVLSD